MSQLVVKSHNPWRLVIIGLLLVAGGWGLFEAGRYVAEYDYRSAKAQAYELRAKGNELQADIVRLRERTAVLERSQQIEQRAYKELEGTVAGLQDEVSELKRELAFYRGIVSPREAASGLRIQRFDIVPNGLHRGYRYKLVLTQVLKNDNVARGGATITFEGTRDGELTTLDLAEVATDGRSRLEFHYRYFQDFEGDITLPDDFVPSRITVNVQPRTRQHGNLDRVFDWPA